MKWALSLPPRWLLLLFVPAVAGLALLSFNARNRVGIEPPDNNPQRFHLSATGTSMSYSFTYDPRAADEWHFRSGGGAIPGPARPRVEMTNAPARELK